MGGINRANAKGEAAENFVKDMFAGSFNLSPKQRLKQWQNTFAYLGNSNNPPDIILKHGDAIEVKKVEKNPHPLALNSSYPKHTLKRDSSLLSKACKACEPWEEKDIIYAITTLKGQDLTQLCMVYGTEFCAEESCYERIKNTIKHGVEQIPNIEFTPTKELGHVNGIDPLGITYLRVRGMWGIENPLKVFNYIYTPNPNAKFNLMCLINHNKWQSFANTPELLSAIADTANAHIQDVEVKNPNNPAQLIGAKLITFFKE